MGSCYKAQETQLCDNLTGCDGAGEGETSNREGMCVHIWLIHFIVKQKLVQSCKVIIFQFLKNVIY